MIKVSVTGLCEFANSSPATRASKLKPFKYNKAGEGAGRSAYYQPALDAIRRYHEAGNDHSVFSDKLKELEQLATTENSATKRAKARCNADAITAYSEVYGKRKFNVIQNHRLRFEIQGVRITASPTLWVEEAGVQVVIKVGVAKKKQTDFYIDMLLHVMRKAAISNGYKVRAKNFVYLDITHKRERIYSTPLARFNRQLARVVEDLKQAWPTITPPPNYSGAMTDVHTTA